MSLLLRAREFLDVRRWAYIKTFDGPIAEKVLRDLLVFCRANESTFDPNTHVSARLDGRREVWLRIQEHLRLSPEQLFELYQGEQ